MRCVHSTVFPILALNEKIPKMQQQQQQQQQQRQRQRHRGQHPYVLLKRRTELKTTFRTLLKPVILISVVATSSYLIILYVMQIAPISRIVAVREASVVFGAIAGYILLKEDFSKVRLLGVVLVMLGIILVKI